MRIHTEAGVVVDLPALPPTEAVITMLAICKKDLPRARFMTAGGDLVKVTDLHVDVEDIKTLNPTTGS